MKRPYQITAILLLLFSAFVVQESFRLYYYTTIGPGPGFFPRWIGGFTGFLAAVMFYQATFGNAGPMPSDFFLTRDGYLRIGTMIVSIICVVLFMDPIGFRLTMLAFLLLMLFTMGRQSLSLTLIISVYGSLGVFHLFNDLLMVPLPFGPWDDFLNPIAEVLIGPIGLGLLVVYIVYRARLYSRVLALGRR